MLLPCFWIFSPRRQAVTPVRGIKWYQKWLNDPNRIVKNMFGDAEKLLNTIELAPSTAGKELVGRTAGYGMTQMAKEQ